MSENIYEKLRLTKTPKEKPNESNHFTQTDLARELSISQQSVSKAERGIMPSLDTVKAYHEYFSVPYNTLLGESNTLIENNVNINKELGLTDECVNTIKNMSDKSLEMLNVFLSYNSKTDFFFSYLADSLTQKEINKEERKKEIEDRKPLTEEDKRLINKRFSISTNMINLDIQEYYINYLKNISSKKLKHVYSLVMEEKVMEYEISDEELETIYSFQDKSIVER